jgi:hypothetical protein
MTGSSGYLPDIGGAIKFLVFWAAVGALATIGGVIWLLIWAFQHISVTA